MARFSSSFIQGLANPSYADGLFTAGQKLGAAPGVAREEQEQKRRQKGLIGASMAIQKGASSGNLTNEQLVDAAGSLAALGMEQPQIMQIVDNARALNTSVRQSNIALLEQGGQEITAQAQRARATQMALQRGDREAAQAIRSGLIDPKEYVGQITKTAEGVTSSRSAGQYKDKEGNIYEVDIQRTKSGSRRHYIPVSPGAPDTPVGQLTPVGGQFRETGPEATARITNEAGETETAKNFGAIRVQAAEELPILIAQLNDINMAMQSLDSISTAGIPSRIENYLRSVTGIQDPNAANYDLLVGEAMYSRLKPLFGGVISNTEREAIEGLYANLTRGNPANRSILKQLKRKLDETIEKANLIRSSENFDAYNMKLDKFFPEGSSFEEPAETKNAPAPVGRWNPETGTVEFYNAPAN